MASRTGGGPPCLPCRYGFPAILAFSRTGLTSHGVTAKSAFFQRVVLPLQGRMAPPHGSHGALKVVLARTPSTPPWSHQGSLALTQQGWGILIISFKAPRVVLPLKGCSAPTGGPRRTCLPRFCFYRPPPVKALLSAVWPLFRLRMVLLLSSCAVMAFQPYWHSAVLASIPPSS